MLVCPIKLRMPDEQLEQLSKPQLIALVRELLNRIDRLESHVAQLQDEVARLKKNSSNSSKPPSSDIVKPKGPNGRKGKRKIGGQPGHPGMSVRPLRRTNSMPLGTMLWTDVRIARVPCKTLGVRGV